MESLSKKKCIPCQGGVPPLGKDDCLRLKGQLNSRWYLSADNSRLYCSLSLKHLLSEIVAVVEKIGLLAEEEGHHPEIQWGEGFIDLQVWTHKIGALVESDFIFAAKVDQIIKDIKAQDELSDHHLGQHWRLNMNRGEASYTMAFPDFKKPFALAMAIKELKEQLELANLKIELGYGHFSLFIVESNKDNLLLYAQKAEQTFSKILSN